MCLHTDDACMHTVLVGDLTEHVDVQTICKWTTAGGIRKICKSTICYPIANYVTSQH
eukprot:m.33035 g.33035  ORF g.33035 m.33035 type:complete len:57 (+) comp14193_c0_seq3:268-438(+)